MKASKIFGLLLTVVAASLFVSQAHAAQLKSTKVSLSNSTAAENSNYTISFSHTTNSTLKSFKLEFCKLPSGDCTLPTGMTIGVNKVNAAWTFLTATDWSVSTNANGHELDFYNAAGVAVPTDQPITISLESTTMKNPSITGCNAGAVSTDTCYLRIATYSDEALTTKIDEAEASFTVVAKVMVTARVDPTFSFVVSAVDSAKTYNGVTTSVSTKYNELPFGNLTANIPKYAAHQLNVVTNTQGGYKVEVAMQNPMTGVFTEDNIDPFIGVWTSPQAWSHPTGQTPNQNTGWFGANTTDTDVTGFSVAASEKFGGISSTPVEVMKKSNSDDGTTSVYVTYAIEANVFQPADTYTGTLLYNALPTY